MNSSEQTFAQKLDELIAACVTIGHPDETSAETATALLEFVFSYERLRRQVTDGSHEATAVDSETIAKMKSWDSNDPSMSTLEKVLRRLAEGRGEEGINLLKTSIQMAAQEFSKKQTQTAKHPRKSRQQPMSRLVEQIVNDDRTISQHQLFKALKHQLATMDAPPYRHSGMSFKSTDAKFTDVNNASLKNFLYRAKKKLSR